MRTLIIYGSNHGCAKKCAELLEGKLKGEVDIADIKNDITLDLNNYDKVIICLLYTSDAADELDEV